MFKGQEDTFEIPLHELTSGDASTSGPSVERTATTPELQSSNQMMQTCLAWLSSLDTDDAYVFLPRPVCVFLSLTATDIIQAERI